MTARWQERYISVKFEIGFCLAFCGSFASTAWRLPLRGRSAETVIRWKAAPGKVYRIEAKERLDQGAWVEVASGLVATSVQESYSVPSAASGQFFRVVVQL